jgi:biotin-dependent carboxylase-like uncharacterized protein
LTIKTGNPSGVGVALLGRGQAGHFELQNPLVVTATLKVLDPGLCTLVVDLGRPACRSLGVPVGGAADRWALALGNGLVGNPPGTAALEICLSGPTLTTNAPLACVLFGAPFTLATDQRPLRPGTTFTLRPEETLLIGGTPRAVRAYLCIRGGLLTLLVLGSRTSFEPLGAGTELPCQAGTIHGRSIRLPTGPDAYLEQLAGTAKGPVRLRALDGPQADWFEGNRFWSSETNPSFFEVQSASNRMGLRLSGSPLAGPDREMVSEPVCPGAVQVTRDGQCIILGVDGQTIGGYPKVAQVISADLDLVGQLRPGDRIQFERVDLLQAKELFHRKRALLREWAVRFQEAEWF